MSGPGRFVYVVKAQFDDTAVADEWLAWLSEGHLADVIAGGALEASAVRWAPLEAEARYVFADAAAFATYERDFAPRLRAEGLARFPVTRGVRMSRMTGERVAAHTR